LENGELMQFNEVISSSLSPLMKIFLKPAQSVVSIKQHSMHIGKSTRMAGTDKSNFEYEVFHEPANPWLWMIKNKLSVEKWSVGLACRRNKMLLGTQDP
jgi:hypothetical protein